jgi:hypothetical protein
MAQVAGKTSKIEVFMKLLYKIVLACGILQAQVPATLPSAAQDQQTIPLSQLQLMQVLEIQRAQYESARDEAQAHADMLEAEKRMNAAKAQRESYNTAMINLQKEFRRDHKCEDCEIFVPGGFVRSTDILFVRPKPAVSTAH